MRRPSSNSLRSRLPCLCLTFALLLDLVTSRPYQFLNAQSTNLSNTTSIDLADNSSTYSSSAPGWGIVPASGEISVGPNSNATSASGPRVDPHRYPVPGTDVIVSVRSSGINIPSKLAHDALHAFIDKVHADIEKKGDRSSKSTVSLSKCSEKNEARCKSGKFHDVTPPFPFFSLHALNT